MNAAAPNATRVEVLHYLETRSRQVEDWVYGSRWLYANQPDTGVWFDVGRSLVVSTHESLNHVFGLPCLCDMTASQLGQIALSRSARSIWEQRRSMCPLYRSPKHFNTTHCPFVHPAAPAAARRMGLDSVQILDHQLDLHGSHMAGTLRHKPEIMDLRTPYQRFLRAGEPLPGYYASPSPHAAACSVRARAQRADEMQRFKFGRGAQVLACGTANKERSYR